MLCAFYEKEITPPLGGDIPGYYLHRYTEDVEDRLYARAAVFAPDSGKPEETAAILTLDSVNMQRAVADAIKARVESFTGIPASHVAVIANHSHYGIPHGDAVSTRDDEFMAILPRLAADAVILASKRLQPCTLTYGIGQESRCAFVRDCVLDDGRVVTNPGRFRERVVRTYSQADPDLPVLTVWDAAGKRMGLIYSFALHQDTTGGTNYSGDFSSQVAKRLKERYGHDCASVFVPGYCGDINHCDFVGGTSWNHRSVGDAVAETVVKVTEEASEAVKDETLAVVTETLILQRRRATEEQLAHCRYVLEDPQARKSPYLMLGTKGYQETLKYEEGLAGKSNDVACPLQVMRLGEVWFFISPYEVYHAFAEPLKQAAPTGKWLISEMANTDASYVPTPELMETDVYPAWLCYGSWLEKDAGDKIVNKLVQMAEKL